MNADAGSWWTSKHHNRVPPKGRRGARLGTGPQSLEVPKRGAGRWALKLPEEEAMNASDERTKSLWMDAPVMPDAAVFDGSLMTDTVVVGSGIAGLSAAVELATAGLKVIVIDRGSLAGGMT
jgi:NADPH-dependent 2,4-dienoyl-CoA reductase/sulfur reductase-like enzyme